MAKRMKKQEYEQLELFPKEHGTGLSTDPDNKDFRKKITRQMSQGGRGDLVADTLHKSNVPLQHLVDMHRHGTVFAPRPYSTFEDGAARYRLSWNNSPGERTIEMSEDQFTPHRGQEDSFTVVHEAGHALHDAMSTQFGGGTGSMARDARHRIVGGNPDPTLEGVADGYAEKYSKAAAGKNLVKVRQRDPDTWMMSFVPGRLPRNEMGYTRDSFLERNPDGSYTPEGFAAADRYARSRRDTFTSGTVPFSGKEVDFAHYDALTKWAESQDLPHTQTETLF